MPLLLLLLAASPARSASRADLTDLTDRHMPPNFPVSTDLGGVTARSWCYPSGLRLQVIGEAVPNIVTVATVVQVGSADDPADKAGLAHLAEHVWFRSSQRGLASVWDLRASAGASLQGFTTPDETVYVSVGNTRSLSTLLGLEADRLLAPLAGVTEAVVETERNIVGSELTMREELHGRAGYTNQLRRSFPEGNRYHLPEHPDAATVTLANLADFFEGNYTPSRTTIQVQGDVVPLRVLASVNALFPATLLGGEPTGCKAPPPTASIEPPAPVDTRLAHVVQPGFEPYVQVSWTLPSGYGVQAGLAAGTLSLVEQGARYSIDDDARCGVEIFREATVAHCVVPSKHKLSPRLVARRVADAGALIASAQEISWTRTFASVKGWWVSALLSEWDQRYDPGSSLPMKRALLGHYTGALDYLSTYYQWQLTPSVATAREMMDRWLTRDRAVVTIFEPSKELVAAPQGTPVVLNRRPIQAATPVDADDPTYLADLAGRPDPSTWTRLTLSNGLRVVGVPVPGSLSAEVQLVLPAGSLREPQRELDSLVRAGVETVRGDWLETSLYRYGPQVGGFWTLWYTPDSLALALRGQQDALDPELFLLRLRLANLKVSGSARRSWLGSTRKTLRVLKRSEDPQIETWTHTVLLGPRYRAYDHALVADRRAVSRAEANDRLDALLNPNTATLVVLGGFDPARLEDLAERWLGDWAPDTRQAAAPALALPTLPALPPRAVRVFHANNTQDYTVGLSCRLRDSTGILSPDMLVLQRLMDEDLWTALRADTGLTYTPDVSLETIASSGVLLHMSGRLPGYSSGYGAATMVDLVARYAGQDIPPERISVARRAVARASALEHAGITASVMPVWAELASPTDDWAERLASADAARLAQLLGDCVGHELIWVRGHAPVATAALVANGLTPTE